MYRKAWNSLIRWKNAEKKKALLITGARQIGKTYLVRELGKEYKVFIEINFITTPGAAEIFSGALDADTIIMNLTALTGKKLIPGDTLIFFDEIQECPKARTAMKFLIEDGRFDYAESGSLLGVNYKAVPSYPVGFETELMMYPMDFEEFCIASGVQDEVIDYLRKAYENRTPVSTAVHDSMLQLFRYYTIVGGMPDVVSTFLKTHDIAAVVEHQKDILRLYRQDIAQYSIRDKARISEIFDRIPSQLDDKNRRFQLSSITSNARMREYEDAFLWLKNAGVALPCYNLQEPKAPLRINEQSRLFKLFLSDCGLLCAECLDQVQFSILQGDLSVNMGSILENVIAQQLTANGFELRYLSKRKVGELDFVIENGRTVYPLEIKSGKDYHSHPALQNALNVEEWNLPEGIVFCKGNVEQRGNILYYPWYMIMFLKKQDPSSKPLEFDFSDLKSLISE